jgi:hypothetical protein
MSLAAGDIDEGTEAVAGALEEPFKESQRSHRANSQLLDLALGLLGHSSWSGTNPCTTISVSLRRCVHWRATQGHIVLSGLQNT